MIFSTVISPRNVLEEDGIGLFQQGQEHIGNDPHIRVSRRSTTQFQEVPDFSEVSGHDHLGLQAVWKNRSGFLRGATLVQQIEVGNFGVLA